jgi:hypothetical protein
MSFQGSVNQALSSVGSAATVKRIISTAAKEADVKAKEADIKAAQQKEAERKRLSDIEKFKHKTEVGERELYATLGPKGEKGQYATIGAKRAAQAEQVATYYEQLYELDPNEINQQALAEARVNSRAVASAVGAKGRTKAVNEVVAKLAKKYPDLAEQGGNE